MSYEQYLVSSLPFENDTNDICGNDWTKLIYYKKSSSTSGSTTTYTYTQGSLTIKDNTTIKDENKNLRFNKSVCFDKAGMCIHDIELGGKDFTIEFWYAFMKSADNSSYIVWLADGEDYKTKENIENSEIMDITIKSVFNSNSKKFSISYRMKPENRFYYYNEYQTMIGSRSNSFSSCTYNKWYYVILSYKYNESKIYYYVNGKFCKEIKDVSIVIPKKRWFLSLFYHNNSFVTTNSYCLRNFKIYNGIAKYTIEEDFDYLSEYNYNSSYISGLNLNSGNDNDYTYSVYLPLNNDFKNKTSMGGEWLWSTDYDSYGYEINDKIRIFNQVPIITNTGTLRDFTGNCPFSKAAYFPDKTSILNNNGSMILSKIYDYAPVKHYKYMSDYSAMPDYSMSIWFYPTVVTTSVDKTGGGLAEEWNAWYKASGYPENATEKASDYYTYFYRYIYASKFIKIYIVNNYLYVSFGNGNNYVSLRHVVYYGEKASDYDESSLTKISANIWHNVAVCYSKDKNKIFLYFDGQCVLEKILLIDDSYCYLNSSNISNIKYYYHLGGTDYEYQIKITNKRGEYPDFKVLITSNPSYNSFIGYIAQVQENLGIAKWPNGTINLSETKSGVLFNTYYYPFRSILLSSNNKVKRNFKLDLLLNNIEELIECNDQINIIPFTTSNITYTDINKILLMKNTKTRKDFNNNIVFEEAVLFKNSIGLRIDYLELFKQDFTISFWIANIQNPSILLHILGSYLYNELKSSDVPYIGVYYASGYLYFVCSYFNMNYIKSIKMEDVFSSSRFPQSKILKVSLSSSKISLWNHIALLYKSNNRTFYIYLNGTLAGTVIADNIDLSKYLYYLYIYNSSSSYLKELYIDTSTAKYTGNNISIIDLYKNTDMFKYDTSLSLTDSTFKDSNAETWTTVGSPTVKTVTEFETFAPNKHASFDKAMYFNGSMGLHYKVKQLYLFFKDFTFSCWIKNESGDSNTRTIFRIMNHIPTTTISGKSYTGIDLCYNGSSNYLILQIISYSAYSTKTSTESVFYKGSVSGVQQYELTTDEEKWKHVAFTYVANEKKFYLYLNGKLLGNIDATNINLTANTYYLWLGFRYTAVNTNNFIGYMRDVEIVSEAKYTEDIIPEIYVKPVMLSITANLPLSNNTNDSYGNTWYVKNSFETKDTSTIPTFNIIKHSPIQSSLLFNNSGLASDGSIKLFTQDFTFKCWAKSNGNYNDKMLLVISAFPYTENTSKTMIRPIVLSQQGNNIRFRQYSDNYHYTNTAGGYSGKLDKQYSLPMLQQKWCHIAITYIKETNTFKIYLNGKLTDTFVSGYSSTELENYVYYIYIGTYYKDNNIYDWIGYIKDVYINSKEALYTEDTISGIYIEDNITYNFISNLPFTSNINDTYSNNIWSYKNTLEIVDTDNIKTFSVTKHKNLDKSLRLNGNNGLYTSGNPIELFTKNFTFSCWFNSDDTSSRYLMQITNILPTDNVSNKTIPVMDIYYNNKIIRFRQYTLTGRTSTSNTGFNLKFELGTTLLDLNIKYHHIAVCYNVSTRIFTLYIDGKLIDSAESKINLIAYLYYIWIGMFYNSSSSYSWKGYIRNVEINGTSEKYTGDTIQGIYAIPDVEVKINTRLRRLLAGLRSRSFNTIVQNAIDAPILYNPSMRTLIQTPKVKSHMLRYIQALRSNTQSLLRKPIHRQKYQFNETQRLLAKYLEFKFNINRTVERTRKAIAISVKSLQ